MVTCWASTNTHLYHVALRFDEFFHRFYNKNECPIHFTIFSNPIQWNWSWIFYYFLKNFWAFLWLESKTMVFVRSSKVTNGWLVTIRDPESVIVTLQGYALQGYNGFLGVTYGYQFHWSLSRTLQMIHFLDYLKKWWLNMEVQVLSNRILSPPQLLWLKVTRF